MCPSSFQFILFLDEVVIVEKKNHLTLITNTANQEHGKKTAQYRCVCGKVVTKRIDRVTNGVTSHCGCMREILPVIGEKFNMLTLLEVLGAGNKPGYQQGLYQCDCGGYKELSISHVRRGARKSCGCLSRVRIEVGQRFGQLIALCPTPWMTVNKGDNRSRWIFQCDCGDRAAIILSELVTAKYPRKTCGGEQHPKTKAGRVNGAIGAKRREFANRQLSFITPDGREVQASTLATIIHENIALFDPADVIEIDGNYGQSIAYSALRHLSRVRQYGLEAKSWKGWTISETERLRLSEEYKRKHQIEVFDENVRKPGPDHFAGKYWELIGPDGVRLEGFNLNELVRTSEYLFAPQDLHWGTTGCNASICLRLLFGLHPDGSRKLQSWKGWSIGAKMERELALMQAHCLERLREQRQLANEIAAS